MLISTTVISEPDDATMCEGRSTTFTCVLNRNIRSDRVQWYRLLPNTSTTERVEQYESGMVIVPVSDNNTFNTALYIFNATKSHTGYYWVRLPSGDDICNVSVTVLTSM